MLDGKAKRADYRTWLLLVLALVPTWSVLAGSGWLWSQRGQEIAAYESAIVPVQASGEFFVIGSEMLRAEASLQAAAKPDAGDDVINQAAQDRERAIVALRDAQRTIGPLLERLQTRSNEEPVDETSDVARQEELFALLDGSVALAVTLIEQTVPGEPVSAEMALMTQFTRNNAGGVVLPLAITGDIESGYFYEAFAATISYHDRFDRDRKALLSAIELGDPEAITQLATSALRDAEWKDLVDSRTYLSNVGNVGWWATSSDPDKPILIDRTDPFATILNNLEMPLSAADRDQVLLAVHEIDQAVIFDVNLASSQFDRAAADHLNDLKSQRRLTAMTSTFMAVLGVALAWLTLSEVRRRRRVEAAHDIAIDQLGEKAHRDPTTGIWNRRRLESVMPELIIHAAENDETVVLAYLDLDHFKAINDVWGHHTGDEVLRAVTQRLNDFMFRDVDFDLCRFGGDEFILHAKVTPQDERWLEDLGSTIIDAIDSEMQVDGRCHAVGVSVGIATSNDDSNLDSLLLEADSSLILAKRKRGTAVIYNRDISRTGELVHALPDALSGGEICAHLQPVIDLLTGEVLHVEALARWNREASGETVSPGVFVPLVESYGLAEELTTTVLRCVKEVIDDPHTPPNVRVWVNVSPRELDVAQFAERLVAILRSIGVPPHRIGLEITETAAVRDPIRLAVELHRLRELGIVVAIDDFGNGYSPLGYLRNLPVDTVKLDRSLISYIDTDIAHQHIVRGVVGLVHELGMSIVAEGVERPEEAAWLLAEGVRCVQGFLFGRPVSPATFSWERREPTARTSTEPVALNA